MNNIKQYTALIAMINQLDDEGLKRAYSIIQRIFLRYGAPGNDAIKEYNQKFEQLNALFNYEV